ncbi:MAG: metallophosphoesterase [Acidobacteriota bacterium]
MRFLVFIAIVFSVYGSANYYVFVRGRLFFPAGSRAGSIYLPVFLVVALAYPVGRMIERYIINAATGTLVGVGSIWLAALLYFVLSLGVIDLTRAVLSLAGFQLPGAGSPAARATAVAVCSLIFLALAAGTINGRSPRLRTIEIEIPLKGRPAPSLPNPLSVAMASDIHIGNTMGPERLGRITDLLSSTSPDLVLLVGDIVDEDMGPVLKRDLGRKLLQIRSRLGVFAVTGNHEYIGGVEEACRYLADHHVRILRDEFVEVAGLWIIGREDLSIRWGPGRDRAALSTLIERAKPKGPVIVLDHQPFHLEQTAESGIDLQLSGHTHHGQLWPLNFITGLIYEKDWGYLRKAGTQYYVSCGAGTWGTPVRTSSRPEVLLIRLRFTP